MKFRRSLYVAALALLGACCPFSKTMKTDSSGLQPYPTLAACEADWNNLCAAPKQAAAADAQQLLPQCQAYCQTRNCNGYFTTNVPTGCILDPQHPPAQGLCHVNLVCNCTKGTPPADAISAPKPG